MKPNAARGSAVASELRIVTPWVRDLFSGAARRFLRDAVIAEVSAYRFGGFVWTAGTKKDKAPTRELAKLRADEALRKAGYTLLALPGGCAIEKE